MIVWLGMKMMRMWRWKIRMMRGRAMIGSIVFAIVLVMGIWLLVIMMGAGMSGFIGAVWGSRRSRRGSGIVRTVGRKRGGGERWKGGLIPVGMVVLCMQGKGSLISYCNI
jgi:hypothetical protein